MRIGFGIAAVALVVVSACGGGDSDAAAGDVAPTPTSRLLSVGQACAQVQLVNEDLDGPGNWPIPTYAEFGDEMAAISRESIPEMQSALQRLSEQSAEIGGMTGEDDVTSAAGTWATRYEVVADKCARTDSPIDRLR